MNAIGNAFRAAAGFLILALVFLSGWAIYTMATWNYTNHQTMTCTVESKDRASGSGGSDIRIYSEDCPVLTVMDLMFGGQFDTADVYQDIEPGKTYTFEVSGKRNQFWSSFQVIRSVTEVK